MKWHSRRSKTRSCCAVFVILKTVCLLSPGQSQEVNNLPQITVTGSSERSKAQLSSNPAANPASVSVLNYSDEDKRNARTYGDLLRTLTGVTVNQFDQGGIPYGITLRGFPDGDHGHDIGYLVDGVPLNLIGENAGKTGDADLNPLIPELVERTILTRGPFDVRVGEFAVAGSLQINTLDQPTPGLTVSGGSFGAARALGLSAWKTGPVNGYGSLVVSSSPGYRDNTSFHQIDTFNKVLFPWLDGVASMRVQIYSSDSGSPGYLDRSLLQAGALSERASVNTTDGVDVSEQNFVFNYHQRGDQPITATAYLVNETLKRWADFATTPVNPALPGQQLNADRRLFLGGTVEKFFLWKPEEAWSADLFLGAGEKSTFAREATYSTLARKPIGDETNAVDFTIHNPFGYVQLDVKPFPWMKLTGAVRCDALFYAVTDLVNRVSPAPVLAVVSPKAGASITPAPGLDLFVNFGEGFRPPDPYFELSFNPHLPVSKNETEEAGITYGSPNGVWYFLGDIYRTRLSNEIQAGAPGTPSVSLGPSERDGFDLEARVQVYQNGQRTLSIFGSFSALRARLLGRSGGSSIPNVADFLAKYGFDLTLPFPGKDSPHVFTLSAFQEIHGPEALDTSRAISTRTFTRVAANLNYTNREWKGFSLFVNLIAYPDRRLEESAFDFGTAAAPLPAVSAKAPVSIQGGAFIPL